MQAYGNDFVIIDCRTCDFLTKIEDPSWISRISDRRYGIGCDQLIVLEDDKRSASDVLMRIFNADGHEVFMCGNALRCVIKLLGKEGEALCISNIKGRLMKGYHKAGEVAVCMGHPSFDLADIPATCAEDHLPKVPGFCAPICVFLGNPHCVFFAQDDGVISDEDLALYGASIEKHPCFLEGVNVEFVTKTKEGFRMRVWERGAGITPSCGSGVNATFSAALKKGYIQGATRIETDGGFFDCFMTEDGVVQKGEAHKVFEGTCEL